jgi:hypothetical protein
MVGRFALALLVIIVSGSLTNAGITSMVLDVFALFGLVLLTWAVVGLFPHRVKPR